MIRLRIGMARVSNPKERAAVVVPRSTPTPGMP